MQAAGISLGDRPVLSDGSAAATTSGSRGKASCVTSTSVSSGAAGTNELCLVTFAPDDVAVAMGRK